MVVFVCLCVPPSVNILRISRQFLGTLPLAFINIYTVLDQSSILGCTGLKSECAPKTICIACLSHTVMVLTEPFTSSMHMLSNSSKALQPHIEQAD